MDDLTTRAGALSLAAALIVPLINVAKSYGLPARAAPLLALALGVALAFLVVRAFPAPPQPWALTALTGLAVGLSASGLYSGVKALAAPSAVRMSPDGAALTRR